MLSKNIYVITSVLLFMLFLIYSSQIDQHIAFLPFDNLSKEFYGQNKFWVIAIYKSISWITAGFIILPICLLILSKVFKIGNFKKIQQFTIIVLTSLALGPGLIINVVFKDNWGRPRPYQVLRDGKTFSPFWKPHFKASNDNSFPSGHASIGFFMGIPFLALGYRRRGLLVAGVGGTFIGIIRILQGGHYVSDIIFSGIFVWLVGELILAIVNATD